MCDVSFIKHTSGCMKLIHCGQYYNKNHVFNILCWKILTFFNNKSCIYYTITLQEEYNVKRRIMQPCRRLRLIKSHFSSFVSCWITRSWNILCWKILTCPHCKRQFIKLIHFFKKLLLKIIVPKLTLNLSFFFFSTGSNYPHCPTSGSAPGINPQFNLCSSSTHIIIIKTQIREWWQTHQIYSINSWKAKIFWNIGLWICSSSGLLGIWNCFVPLK